MQEFGTVQEYRQAWDQLKHYKSVNAKELKAEAKKRQELEREELKLKDLEELIAKTRAKSNLKAKTAESEGKLLCNQCQASMFPDAEGFYEFESNFHFFLPYCRIDGYPKSAGFRVLEEVLWRNEFKASSAKLFFIFFPRKNWQK